MKTKIYLILLGLSVSMSVFAQAPQKMSYQAIIRNSSNALIASTTIGVKISILQGSETGTAVYIERQTPTTNANGLLNFEIGNGTVLSGTIAAINWANGPYYIKTESDPTGGTTYTITGINQFNSVPYALFSANGTSGIGGFSHYIGEYYLGGVIYHLFKGSDGLEHGLIISLLESSPLKWQTTTSYVGADRSWDGIYNTALMINSPAKNYVAGFGTGWYLPSADELQKLFLHFFEVNKALQLAGYTILSPTILYWSSSESNDLGAYYYDPNNGDIAPTNKVELLKVRAVKSF